MKPLEQIINNINAAIGRNQEFEQLIAAKDISRVIGKMNNQEAKVNKAICEYNPHFHEIMKREDKEITDKNGNYVRTEKTAKLPIPRQKLINEIALVFLYGRPVKWTNNSTELKGCEEAYNEFINVINDTHFNSRIRQCKRLAGAETESAMLFRVYKDENNKPKVQIKVLAKSLGDEIYTRWDIYGNMINFAWGYYTKEGNTSVHHIDIFTKDIIYKCKKNTIGWEVIQETNLVGKIPVIYFSQEKEWQGVEPLIEREENVISRDADTNDYFGDPLMLINSHVISSMPSKGDPNKTIVVEGMEDMTKAVGFATWDSASESKKNEFERLEKLILTHTFTPKIDIDTMKTLSNVSGKALKQLMLLATIKSERRKETHDELLTRVSSLILSIIGNVTNISIKAKCEKAIIGHEFQEPFADDIQEAIQNITNSIDNGTMSQETGLELNPLVKNVTVEKERITLETEKKIQQASSIFDENQVM